MPKLPHAFRDSDRQRREHSHDGLQSDADRPEGRKTEREGAQPDEESEEAHEEQAGGWKAVLDGRVNSLLASMDRAGVEISVVCPIATKPAQVEGIFNWCKEIRSRRIAPFPSVHPDSPDAVAWLERFASEGFRGIKLHPMYQQFAIDEERALNL